MLDSANTDKSVETKTEPSPEYKSLQKQLTKTQKQLKDASVRAEGAEASVKRLDEMYTKLAGLYGTNVPESAAAVQSILNESNKAKQTDTYIRNMQSRLDKAVERAGIEWEDESLADARAAWEDGRLDEALELVNTRPTLATGADTIRQIVQEELKKVLKVDTGGSSTTAPRKVSRADLANFDPRGRTVKSMNEELDKVLAQVVAK